MGVQMKIVVDIPDELLDRVREAIHAGAYDDSGEFVTVALENQVELELSENQSSEIMTLEEAVSTRHSQSDEGDSKNHSGGHGPGVLGRVEYDEVPTVPPPRINRLDDGPLWGQYNRIFPVKLALRALANEIHHQAVTGISYDTDEWVSLNSFSNGTAEIAREFGLRVKQEDNNQSRGQGQKLSAALPVGNDPGKSKERYRTHFVGYAEQGGDLTGAAPHLLFINIPEDSPDSVGITQAGLEFAEMWNPLIDGDVTADRPLSDDEVSYYIEHVRNNLPEEFEAMLFTARAIRDGDNRPESLSSRVATINEDWSTAQSSTIRSGLVSRMYELGLVRRERVGQRGVAYRLTDTTQKLLESN